jgi:Cu(I)/Ag(I) efflux system membrane fusion protein
MNTMHRLKVPVLTLSSLAPAAILALPIFLAACGKQEEPRAGAAERAPAGKDSVSVHEEHAGQTLYQCPMHPQILRKEPGSCPICGMTLVPVHPDDSAGASGASGADAEHAAPPAEASSDAPQAPVVRVDAAMARNVGLRTRRAERAALARSLRLDGKVAVDENRVVSVTARVGGFAEVVRARATGVAVRRGETLLEVYSPEVTAAQARLLQAGQADGDAQETRERLANWGVPAAFTARIEKNGRAERRFPVVAPAGGVVLLRAVLEGQAVSPGMELYRIADVSEVWVTARVYASDLAWVRKGSRVALRFPNLPGTEIASEVFFVAPEADEASRTVEIRMRARNTPALDLKPGLLAEVAVDENASAPVLVVPSQALIRTGTRVLAVVARGGGRYQPVEVATGRESGGRTEILRGLAEGDEVVESAQFLIDAESNLRAAVRRLQSEGESHDH